MGQPIETVEILSELELERVCGADTQRADGGGCTDPDPLPDWMVQQGLVVSAAG